MKDKLESYITIPRDIARDWRDGKLTPSQRNLLIWLRVSGNPYGITTVHMETLAKEAFNNPVSKDHINRLLIELKEKRYIFYKARKGRRGSFDVYHKDWVLLDGSISSLDKYFQPQTPRSVTESKTQNNPEPRPKEYDRTQNFKSVESLINKRYNFTSSNSTLRGSDNDTNTNKNNDYQSLSIKEDIKTKNYKVIDEVSSRLKFIAEEIEEESMGFILSVHRKHGDRGIVIMEKVISNIADYPDIRNKGALFNSQVMRLLKEGPNKPNIIKV